MPDPISWSLVWKFYLAAFAGGYLLGSIPFGLIVTRLGGAGDIRSVGSGNIGATNVLRTGNKLLAALTLLGDMLKGFAAVYFGAMWGPETAIIAAFGAFLGHCFPVWLKFRGGKGVATYIGVLLGLNMLAFFAAALVWLAVAAVTRYSSLAALLATATVPGVLYYTGRVQLAELFLVLTVILWFRHRQNIARLVAGTEGRIGSK
ncbi:MAG TPA: glycerol-3-phosphate 1-O-acyltransferase PlsY [Afifellaceae bacterium]|nr:glycerol-3-phosphate 1-O-acyltransferase PlsY [Afifellaceae bacterium]